MTRGLDDVGPARYGRFVKHSSLYRPAPLRARAGKPVDRRTHFAVSARRLLAGETLWVRDHYHTGLGILDALVSALRPGGDRVGHAEKQRYREAFRETAFRLLVPVSQGRVDLDGGVASGFLHELYPDLDRFWLPLPEVRDLGFAWERYHQGVFLPVLGHRIHPFYGTYLPKRTAHLELFATWLAQWKGARKRAVDVGTGSGVLALLLARAGVESVHATDVNRNAVESVRRELSRRSQGPITVEEADLLGGADGPLDLVVFNPPWTLGRVDNLLDQALVYEPGLFERFFAAARERISPAGRVVLVFSNVIGLVQPTVEHPIEAELARGRFSCVQVLRRRIKPPRGADPGRRRTKEKVEVWELAPV